MNIKISTRLLLGFGVLIGMTLLMVVLGVFAVASLDNSLARIVHGNYRDTMDTVDIRETVNEVARAVYNLAGTDQPESRRKEVARLENSEKIILKNFETLKANLEIDGGALLLKNAQDAYRNYAAARSRVIAFALQNQDTEMARAIQQDLRPAQNSLFNALDAIVNYQTERMDRSAQQAQHLAQLAKTLLVVIGILTLACGVMFSLRIARSISRPTLAASRLTQAISAGDLTRQVSATSRDELGLLLEALEKMRLALTNEVRTIRHTAESVALASDEIALGSADLSSKAEHQAAQLEETAASMEQLTVTVKQNADSAARAKALANSASEVATRGGGAVRGVVGTMQGISESSRRIADIIGVIDTIAFQTNILALNAAVEAARAGEQGRGFAVVAAEVRALAQRSAQAAKEISGLIQTSSRQVDAGAKLVENAGTTMDEIVTAVTRVTDIIAGIATASHEQLISIEQVNQAVSQMSGVTQQNAAVVGQSAAAAENLSAQAQELITAVARFKVDHDGDGGTGRRNRNRVPTAQDGEPRSRETPATAGPARAPRLAAAMPPTTTPPRRSVDEGSWKSF